MTDIGWISLKERCESQLPGERSKNKTDKHVGITHIVVCHRTLISLFDKNSCHYLLNVTSCSMTANFTIVHVKC